MTWVQSIRNAARGIACVMAFAVVMASSLPDLPGSNSTARQYKVTDRIAIVLSSQFSSLIKASARTLDYITRVSAFIIQHHLKVVAASPSLQVNAYQHNVFYVLASINAP